GRARRRRSSATQAPRSGRTCTRGWGRGRRCRMATSSPRRSEAEMTGGYVYPRPRVLRRAIYAGKPSIKLAIEQAVIEEMERLGWSEGGNDEGRVTKQRFLYYRLESLGVIDKAHPKHGDRLSEVVTDLLWAGVFPLWSIADRGRDVIMNTGYTSVREGLLGAPDGISLTPWRRGIPRPLLIVESDSLAGVIDQIASEYRTPLAPLRGQGSTAIC